MIFWQSNFVYFFINFRELWMKSGTSSVWWKATQNFARTAAVSSIMGSILGLGDRHLDNLLINLNTGKLIHVDYNVCFEKGCYLRVPEIVPFRLTSNIIYALGPTQIEGVYRESCQHILSQLRNQKAILLRVLDTFRYDTLVEWPSNKASYGIDGPLSSLSLNLAMILAVYGKDIRQDMAPQVNSVKIQFEKNPSILTNRHLHSGKI